MTEPVVSQHMAQVRAIVAALKAVPVLADGKVVAHRRRPMAQQTERQVFVYLEESLAQRGEIRGAPFDWRTRVRVECVARDVPGAMAEDVADALMAQAYARVMQDTTLGGLALDVIPEGAAWTGDEADTTLSAAQLIFTVLHVTAEGVIAST